MHLQYLLLFLREVLAFFFVPEMRLSTVLMSFVDALIIKSFLCALKQILRSVSNDALPLGDHSLNQDILLAGLNFEGLLRGVEGLAQGRELSTERGILFLQGSRFRNGSRIDLGWRR